MTENSENSAISNDGRWDGSEKTMERWKSAIFAVFASHSAISNDGRWDGSEKTMERWKSAIFAVFASHSAISNDGRWDGSEKTMERWKSAIFAVFASHSAIFNDGMEARKRWNDGKARFSLFSPVIALFSLFSAPLGSTGAEQRSTGPYFHSVSMVFAEKHTNCAVLSACKQRTIK